jgi:hypothetical protein
MRRRTRVGFGLLALGSLVGAAACSAQTESTAATTTVTTAAPDTSTSTTELPLTAGRQISFYVPAVGDCFDLRQPDPKKPDKIVLKLDCNLPHDNEVFGVFDVAEKDFPGQEILDSEGKMQCPKQFKAYVGLPYETSVYEMGYYTPTAADWGQGIRHVTGCYVFDAKGNDLTGSVKGSGK